MAPFFLFALFIMSLVLQGSVLALTGTSGIHPDLLLVIVVALGLLSDSKRGAAVGLAAGLLQDILFGSPLGFFAFTKTLIGATAGMLSDDIYKDYVLAPMLLMIFFSAFSDFTTFLLARLYHIQQPYSLTFYMQQTSLIRLGMHFLIMGLIYPYLYRAQRHRLLFPHAEHNK